MRELIYVPLERYASRYTEYQSGPDGTIVAGICNYKEQVKLTILEGTGNELHKIKNGVVLDTTVRAKHGFKQTQQLLALIHAGKITNESVIFIEDFWHPGMEMIPYACRLMDVRPQVFAFCYAQSVDPHDFTAKMKPWIRHFERGWAEWLTGIFVAAPELKHMLLAGDIGTEEKIHVVGLPYDRDTVLELYGGLPTTMDPDERPELRQNRVLFTSRFDKEKNPEFFMKVATEALRRGNAETEFAYVSGRSIPSWIKARHASLYPGTNVTFRENQTKEQYLALLCSSTSMLNCAKQDFVSYALLDALAYGCAPICPNYLTFPDVLGHNPLHLYDKESPKAAYELVEYWREVVKNDNEYMLYVNTDTPDVFKAYGKKYEHTMARIMSVMFPEPTLQEWFTKERGV